MLNISKRLIETRQNHEDFIEIYQHKLTADEKETKHTLLLGLVIMLVFYYIICIVPILGTSMLPTIDADREEYGYVIMYRLPLVRCGDVVIVNNGDKNIIKRIVAVGGDTVEISPSINDEGTAILKVNGVVVDEPYIREPMSVFSNMQTLITLAPDEIYVLGDNRNNSSDSRVYGTFKLNDVIGRVYLIFNKSGIKLV